MNDITVCIPTIPPRWTKLQQAFYSATAQTLEPAAVIVEWDHHRTGAAATKNRALARVTTEYVAFLDDDDEFLSHHLATLRACAEETGADVVYSIPQVPGTNFVGTEPQYGKPFDAEVLRQRSFIQTTSLVRTELFKKAGGFQTPPGSDYDDWGAWLALLALGAKFVHVPEVTFVWNHYGVGRPGIAGNTSGRPDRW